MVGRTVELYYRITWHVSLAVPGRLHIHFAFPYTPQRICYFIIFIAADERKRSDCKYDDRDYDDYDDRERRNLRDDRDYRRRSDDYDDYDDYDNYDERRDYRDYDDRNDNRPRREKVIDDRQYEYDMRDYERREKRLPNNINSNNNIDKRENDSRYEKVYELKPEYKLKSDNNKRIR